MCWPDFSAAQMRTYLEVQNPETALRSSPGILPAKHVHFPAYERRLYLIRTATSVNADAMMSK